MCGSRPPRGMPAPYSRHFRQFGAHAQGHHLCGLRQRGFRFTRSVAAPGTSGSYFTSIGGVRFADAWPNRVTSNFDGIPVTVISRRGSPHEQTRRAAALKISSMSTSLLEAEGALGKPKREAKPRKKKPKRNDDGSSLNTTANGTSSR